jgi:hypothetical protein
MINGTAVLVNPTFVFTVIAVGLSLLAFLWTVINANREGSGRYISRLERRVKELEARVEHLEGELNDARTENIDLMRRLVAKNGGVH